ncbi:MAG: M48 family metallopeptidase [Candidatus Micrarchaeia archaeon]
MQLDNVIEVDGRAYKVEYLHTDSKIARATVRDGVVVIKMPKRYCEKEKEEVFRALREKVIRRLRKDPWWGSISSAIHFYDGQEFDLYGDHFKIVIEEHHIKRTRASFHGNIILIKIPIGIGEEEKEVIVSKRSRRLISRLLLDKITNKVRDIGERSFGLQVNKVAIRSTSSRWGSCNVRSRNIHINFLLLFAPEWILDYVIIHEIAHIKEPNHSERFWAIVSQAFPRYKEAVVWLRKNGRRLGPEFNYK